MKSLIEKYNVSAPRYTSYPTVPFWDTAAWNEEGWLGSVRKMYQDQDRAEVGVYVHLPYCEDLCTYCGCNTRITKNHSVEEPYIDSLLKEWDMYLDAIDQEDLQIADLHLGGGTPTFFKSENLKKLIEGLLKGKKPIAGATFSFEAHPGNTTLSHLQTLYDLGFRRLSLGIQDFDTKVQLIINRKQSESDVLRVMDQAKQIGFESINFDLIYGLPLQTRDTVSNTIKTALKMRPERISFYSYAHVPWLKPAQRRFTDADLPVGSEKLALYKLGKDLIQAAGYKDVGMDHFSLADDALFEAAKSGSLHRNFMGYTDKHVPLLIGLGVSSISDSWYAFAQNVKTVEAYHNLINAGKLPLMKGHLLSEEDLMLRRHILNMMCQGKTLLNTEEKVQKQVMARLEPFVEDELVILTPLQSATYSVEITALGKSFLRPICMAFDQRMLNNTEEPKQFSQAV